MTDSKNLHERKWQEKLLPLMKGMLVGLTLFFFTASCIQLVYLHRSILNTPQIDLQEVLSPLTNSPQAANLDILAATRLKAEVTLEADALSRQYHQAGVLLMARLWTTYLGFITGMILSLVGAGFILGKLQEDVSDFAGKIDNVADISLKTSSPGLVLTALGVILMIASIVTHHEIDVKQSAIYLREPSAPIEQPPNKPPPTLVIPEVKKTPLGNEPSLK